MHLVDHARAYIEASYKRPLPDRLLRSLLAAILPHRGRFRLALRAAQLGKPLAGALRACPPSASAWRHARARAGAPAGGRADRRAFRLPAGAARKARVALLVGCAQPVLKPSINAATSASSTGSASRW